MLTEKMLAISGSLHPDKYKKPQIYKILESWILKFKKIKTGGAIGIDKFSALIIGDLKKKGHEIHHTIIFPGDRRKVPDNIEWTADTIIQMPQNSTFRARNRQVLHGTTDLLALPNGSEKPINKYGHYYNHKSGTLMTVNMAIDLGINTHIFWIGNIQY
jgi:hypothetical protein